MSEEKKNEINEENVIPLSDEADEEKQVEKPGIEAEQPDYLDQLKRLQAEFINYKRRVERQQGDWFDEATRQVLSGLLPVLDDFDHYFKHSNEQEHEVTNAGVKLIYDKLMNQLRNLGLEEIGAQGEVFDPEFHEAVKVEQVDTAEHGTILEVWQKGYKYKDKLLRPARVKVAG